MNLCDNEESARDAIFEALTHEHRRMIFAYLAEQPEVDVDCTEVVDYLSLHDTSESDHETLDIQCHHVHFPKLDEAGLITHDVERNTVHIEQREVIENLVDLIEELE